MFVHHFVCFPFGSGGMEAIFETGILKQEYPDTQDLKEFLIHSYLNSNVKIIQVRTIQLVIYFYSTSICGVPTKSQVVGKNADVTVSAFKALTFQQGRQVYKYIVQHRAINSILETSHNVYLCVILLFLSPSKLHSKPSPYSGPKTYSEPLFAFGTFVGPTSDRIVCVICALGLPLARLYPVQQQFEASGGILGLCLNLLFDYTHCFPFIKLCISSSFLLKVSLKLLKTRCRATGQ